MTHWRQPAPTSIPAEGAIDGQGASLAPSGGETGVRRARLRQIQAELARAPVAAPGQGPDARTPGTRCDRMWLLVALSLFAVAPARAQREQPQVAIDLVRIRAERLAVDTAEPRLHEFIGDSEGTVDLGGVFGAATFAGSTSITVPQTIRGGFSGSSTSYGVTPNDPYVIGVSGSGDLTNQGSPRGFCIIISGSCDPADWDPSGTACGDTVRTGETKSISHSATCASAGALVPVEWAYRLPGEEWPPADDYDEIGTRINVSSATTSVALFPIYRVPRVITDAERVSGSVISREVSAFPGETVTVRVYGTVIGDASAADLGTGITTTLKPDDPASSSRTVVLEATVDCVAEFGARPIRLTTPRGVIASPAEVTFTVKDPLDAASGSGAGNDFCPADVIELRNLTPAAGQEIEQGSEQAFMATALYTLQSRDDAEVDLELRDQQDNLLGAIPFVPVSRGLRMTLPVEIDPVEIPRTATRLFLRARMLSEGRLLALSTPIEYPVAPERSVRLTVESPIFAGDDSHIDVEVVDERGQRVATYTGNVELSLAASSTKGIGLLAVQGAGGPGNKKITVSIAQGRGRAILSTPEIPFTPATVIKPTTVLEGIAALEARIVGGRRVAQESVQVNSPLDLRIDAIRVLQAVNESPPSRLVRFRPMIVRLFIDANTSQFADYDRIEGITAKLSVTERDGSHVPGSPFTLSKGSFNGTDMPSVPYVFRRQLSTAELIRQTRTGAISLNAVVPVQPIQGDSLSIQATLDKVYADRNRQNDADTFGIVHASPSRVVRLRYGRATFRGQSNLPDMASMARMRRYIALAYPVSEGNFQFIPQPTTTFILHPPPLTLIGNGLNQLYETTLDASVYFVDETYFAAAGAEVSCCLYGEANRYLATMIVASPYCTAPTVSPPRPSSDRTCDTLAHEVGHLFTLGDTYVDDKAHPNPDVNPLLPNNDGAGNLVEDESFDWTKGKFVVLPDQVHDFMGNSGEGWVDVTTWNVLKDKLRVEAGAAARDARQVPGTFVLIQGRVRRDGDGELGKAYVLSSAVDPRRPAPGGSLVLETVDGAGAVVDSFAFEPDFRQPDRVEPLDAIAFGYWLRFDDGAREIRMRWGERLLGSRVRSPSAPAIELVTVPDAAPLSGTATVSWSGTDADGDDLTYSLFYSPDGQLHIPLVEETTDTSYLWDTELAPAGPAPVLSLLATDGVNATMIDSALLNVPNRTPQIVILTPHDGAEIDLGEQLIFEGDIFDLEDPLELDPAIEWESDRQGDLGRGRVISRADLVPGRHRITASGADRDGSRSSTAIEIIVLAPCGGDCNNDGQVAIDEIVRGVNIALGGIEPSVCLAFDTGGDGVVTVDELVRAVNHALSGCPQPTPSRTATPGRSPTRTDSPLAQPSSTASPSHSATRSPPATPTNTHFATPSRTPLPPPPATSTPTATPAQGGDLFCAALATPLPIPDDDAAGSRALLTVGESTVIEDLDVRIAITHGFVGDLTVTLSRLDTGTTAVLVDRPGSPADVFGCDGPDLDSVIDDEAVSAAEDTCAPGRPALGGRLRPNEPLQVFDGEAVAGTWVLDVVDGAEGTSGELIEWCLELNRTSATPVPGSAPVVTDFGCDGSDACPIEVGESFTLSFGYSDSDGDASSWRVAAELDGIPVADLATGDITPPNGVGRIDLPETAACAAEVCVFVYTVVVTDVTGRTSQPRSVDVIVIPPEP